MSHFVKFLRDHADLLQDQDMPINAEAVNAAAKHVEKLEAERNELLALLVESQTSIGGDWRARRDAAIRKARGES